MITPFIQLLKELQLNSTAEELADTLWLASFLDPPTSEEVEQPSKGGSGSSSASAKAGDNHATNSNPLSKKVRATVSSPNWGKSATDVPTVRGLPLAAPTLPALPNTLAIERALRPLMRRVPSRTHVVLHEEATIQRIADEDNWVPIMRPAPSCWLDVLLVVDESPSMVIWQETIVEWERLLKRLGAFRKVQSWGFMGDSESEQIQLYAGIGLHADRSRGREPHELLDPYGQHLILVMSDCVSPVWYQRSIIEMLESWAQKGPVAIIQMLPERLWSRTALGEAVRVDLRAPSAGTANRQLEVDSIWSWFDDEDDEQNASGLEAPAAEFPVPVVTLEARTLKPWAKSLAGSKLWIPGVLFSKSAFDESPLFAQESASQSTINPTLSADQLFQRFKASTSPIARQLAGYLAAVPLTLPIMRIVQREMLPDSTPDHLAEVLLSGLIKQEKAIHSHELRYDFVEGVRDFLLSTILISETVNVLDLVFKKISNFIDRKTGQGPDFRALVADPEAIDQIEFEAGGIQFATIATKVLRRLGSNYAKLAKRLEERIESPDQASKAPSDTKAFVMSPTFSNGHALIIGVGGDLPNTVEDATRLANILKDPERCAYPPEYVHLLIGKQATRDGILAKLDVLAQTTDAKSTVVVYFSGFGYQVISTMGESYYLLPYGYRVTRLYKTAISGSELTAKLRAIPAQKVLLLLDCCHAGGVGEAKTPELEMSKAPLPPEALALLNEGRGRVVIASSREDELSYGGRPVSVFTQAMIESLCGVGVAKKDGYVRVADIALHARQVVPTRTKDKQHPILHFEHADNFVLAYYAGGDKQPKRPPFPSPPQIEPELGAGTLSGHFEGPLAGSVGGNYIKLPSQLEEPVKSPAIHLFEKINININTIEAKDPAIIKTFTNGHALIIGVGGDLPNTVEDAARLADILKDPERCAYPPEHVHLLIGKQATRDGILAKLSALAQTTDAESTVVVYFSGFGYQVISTMGEHYYLLPYGYKVRRLYKTAIQGRDFAAKLRAIPAQKVLLLFDCCHAGGVGEAKTPELEMAKAPLRPDALDLFKEGMGRVLIASSRKDELSYGGRPVSVFTQAMIESLCGVGVTKKDGYVRVADIALHARQVVPKRTKGKQHPILHFEYADNFVVAYYAGGDKQPKRPPFASPPQIEPEPGAWTLLGHFEGPVAVGGGDAVDLRGSQGAVYKPSGSVKQYFTEMHKARAVAIGDNAQVEVTMTPPQEPPKPKNFVNIWYTAKKYKFYEIRNPDLGTLSVSSESAEYRGEKEKLILTDIKSVSHTKHSGDINNNWVKVEYGDRENPRVAYFADAKRLGVGFLFGGSQDILGALRELVR